MGPESKLAGLSDAELWNTLQQGNRDALGALYDRYAGLVYGIALKALSHSEDAEDLTQDIFLKLSKSSYDPERGSLQTFLAILTRSRSIDRLRSRQRQQSSLQRIKPELQELAQSSSATASETDSLAYNPHLQQAFSQLSKNQRQVLNLAYREGLSQSEIAQQLDKPLGTVKAWARRGLIKLRKRLQSDLEDL